MLDTPFNFRVVSLLSDTANVLSRYTNSMNVVQIDFKKIREAAEKTGLSTREIAAKSGSMTHSTVHSILNGDTNPTAINVKAICDVIGLAVESVFIEKIAA